MVGFLLWTWGGCQKLQLESGGGICGGFIGGLHSGSLGGWDC